MSKVPDLVAKSGAQVFTKIVEVFVNVVQSGKDAQQGNTSSVSAETAPTP